MLCVACCLAGREQHAQIGWGRALASRRRHLQHKLNSMQHELGVAWMLLLRHSSSCAKDNSGLLSKISAAIKTGQTEVRRFWKRTLWILCCKVSKHEKNMKYIVFSRPENSPTLKEWQLSSFLLLSESQWIWDDDCYLSELFSGALHRCAKPVEPVILFGWNNIGGKSGTSTLNAKVCSMRTPP